MDLPSSINEVGEEITKELIKCSECGRAYRIIFDEFQFLKNLGIPLPRYCNECRFAKRQKFMVPPVLKESQCMCAGVHSSNLKYKNTQVHNEHNDNICSNKFMTAYDTNKEIIYCEKCYKQEVY
jgi:uncharacterized protein YbaR (Trm112 family)